MTVTVWDKQAEACCQYLHKGRPVFVEGVLQSRFWETSDGQKRSAIDVRAERVQFLGSYPGAKGKEVEKAEGGVEAPAPEGVEQHASEAIKPEDVAWDG